jgi:hypothetical protein
MIMTKMHYGAGCSLTVDEKQYTADSSGVVEVPGEAVERLLGLGLKLVEEVQPFELKRKQQEAAKAKT